MKAMSHGTAAGLRVPATANSSKPTSNLAPEWLQLPAPPILPQPHDSGVSSQHI
jgi:hypothetical protein